MPSIQNVNIPYIERFISKIANLEMVKRHHLLNEKWAKEESAFCPQLRSSYVSSDIIIYEYIRIRSFTLTKKGLHRQSGKKEREEEGEAPAINRRFSSALREWTDENIAAGRKLRIVSYCAPP